MRASSVYLRRQADTRASSMASISSSGLMPRSVSDGTCWKLSIKIMLHSCLRSRLNCVDCKHDPKYTKKQA